MAGWLDDVLGPKPAPRIVSRTTTGAPTMPTGGGSAPGFDIASLLAKLDAEQKAQNQSGLDQYQNLLGTVSGVKSNVLGPNGLYDQAAALQSGMGTAQNTAINQGETKAKAQSDQDLTSRGLGNTTVRSTAQRGIASDATNARSAVAESVAGAKAGLLTQRAGAEQNIGNMQGDAILSKTSTPNNMNLYAQLIQQLMANGGGGGGRSSPYASNIPDPGVRGY